MRAPIGMCSSPITRCPSSTRRTSAWEESPPMSRFPRQADKELAIRREDEPRAEMVRSADLGLMAEDHLDVPEGAIPELCTRDSGGSAALAGLGIGEVDEAVGYEARVKRHIEETALAFPEDPRYASEGLGKTTLLGHDPQPAGPLRHEHVSVRQEGKAQGKRI